MKRWHVSWIYWHKGKERQRGDRSFGESAHFDGVGDVKAWIRTLELIYDAKGLTIEERFLHTLPLLSKSALKIYEYSHPTTYSELCNILVSTTASTNFSSW